MAGAGEVEERIAGDDLSGAGSPATRMEGKWEKDTAGTSHGTCVLCPSDVPASRFSPGMGRVSANPRQVVASRGAGQRLQQNHPAQQLRSLARSHRAATCDQGCCWASKSPCARSRLQGRDGPIRCGALLTRLPRFV